MAWVVIPFEAPEDAVNALRVIRLVQGYRGAVIQPLGELRRHLEQLLEENLQEDGQG